MLPRPLRLTRPADHRRVVRAGRRAAAGTLTVHLLQDPVDNQGAAAPARAGLVVGKPVGNAVARHRVSRRLRHLLATRLDRMAPGSLVVVRARPGAADPAADLAADLDTAFRRLTRGSARPPAQQRRRVPPGDPA